MSRQIDLTKKLSEEDRAYLLARGKEQLVLKNDVKFVDNPDPELVRQASYVPGTSIDRAEGVPPTPNGDQRVVMGGGEVETDEDEDAIGDSPASHEVAGSDEEGDNYETWTKKQLRQEIESRNADLPEDEQMPVSGDKPDLIARLRENDEEEGE